MYEITDESSLRYAMKDYLRFYSEERPQDRYHCKTPLEVRQEALVSDVPTEYPIPENKRINKYKEKWCAQKNAYISNRNAGITNTKFQIFHLSA